jgi:hypothetical protein
VSRRPLSPEAQAIYETPLSPEEFAARLGAALADEEQMQANLELCRWFLRRYPTAAERLAYARRKYAEATVPMVDAPPYDPHKPGQLV